MKQYINNMYKCLELAKQGAGMVSPNPMVGCVVLGHEGEIVSTGYHKGYGLNHAERDALLKLENAQGFTLVVNLEPCSHFGKTPPCADLIIEKGIKKVVFGMYDPNPLVSGKGIKKLKDAGVEVIGPVLEEECRKFNEVFIKNFIEHKTFVAIKTATTIDGKISTCNGNSKWITGENARNEVRNIRKIYDAILTSSSTVIADNPVMEHKKKVIIDRELKTDLNSEIYKQGNIFVFYDKEKQISEKKDNVVFIPSPVKSGKIDIEFVLKTLYEYKIMSILVEAGGELNGSFLPYADKIYHFVAPKILNDNGGKSCFNGDFKEKISDCTNLEFEEFKIFEPDVLLIYSKNN